LYASSNFTSANSWNSPPATYQQMGKLSVAKGYSSSCPAGLATFTAANPGVDGTTTSMAQTWANNAADGTANHQKASVELKSPNEINDLYWKKFAGNGATLSIQYNSTPSVVAGRSTSPCGFTCDDGGDGQLVNVASATPWLYGQASDPNGNPVTLSFEVWAGTAASPTTRVVYGSSASVPSGQETYWPVTTGYLSNGSNYEWRARAFNGTNFGPWGSWTIFTVDTTAPAAPTISSTFPSLGTGTSGSFTWTDSSTDVFAESASLDGIDYSDSVVWGNSASDPSTLAVTGLSGGGHVLEIDVIDGAANVNVGYFYFAIGNGTINSPADQARTQQSVALTATAPSGYGYAWYEYRVGSTGSFAPISLPGGGSSPVTVSGTGADVNAWPVASSASLSWNMASTVGADGLVQVEACFGTSSSSPSICTSAHSVQLATHAFAESDATQQVGPGTVALLTGDYAVSATDVNVPSYQGSLTLGRTFTTLSPTTASGAAGVFGPGWRAAFYGPNAGHADATFVDHSASGYVTLVDPDGTEEIYNSNGSTYVGVADTAADGSTITKDSSTQYTLTERGGTQTVYSKTSGGVWGTTKVVQASGTPAATTTTYTLDSVGRVTQILAPVPDGVDCSTAPTTTAGCRTLQFSYADTTTASGETLGDYSGQLAGVSFTSYDPATSAMTTVQVAAYAYDADGRLRQAWDPRISPHLVTAYTYDTNGRLATLTPPGLSAWTLSYDGSGRLASVQHPDPSGPTATQTIAYDVAWDGTGPVDLRSSVTSAWGQSSDIVDTATAVFPADHVPAGTPGSADWPYAAITYMDVNGRPVNTAAYGNGGWQISATRYDPVGNPLWSISPGNLAQAASPTAATDPAVAAMSSETQRANALATINTYSSDGTELLTTLGPTHPMQLASGSTIDGRQHVVNTYDQGAPGGGPYRLVTTSVRSAQIVNTSTDNDAVTTQTGYAALVSGDVTGWVLHKPTSVTTVMASGGNLVAKTRYNDAGQVIESRAPMAGVDGSGVGDDAHTTDITYYTATGSGACVSAPLAGLLCSTGPAAQPSTGKPLPVTTTTYNVYDQPLTVTQTAGGVTRTATTGYDAAGRTTSSAVVVDPAGADGAAVPARTFSYDADTGLPTTTTDSNAKTVTTGYDALGRTHTYTDSTGSTTTTSYDIDGRPSTVTDPKGTTTYTYDGGTGEHRGLVTSISDSLAGTFNGSYDDDGQLTSQTYPGGLVATYSYDNAGASTEISYTESGVTWLDCTAARDSASRIVASNDAAGTTSSYSYDNAGRLTTATDDAAGTCTSRAYGFNADSDRTSETTSSFAATAGACTGSGTPTTVNHSYDQADRITDTGYSYDDFGRTLTVPSADAGGSGDVTLGYYANDLVQQISGTVDGQASSKGYGLDAVGRVLSESGGAPVTPATPTVDQNITATDVTDGSGTISTDTFNTTHPNETLVALVAAGGGTSTQTVSVTGAGLSWSRVAQANSQRGDAEIWTATTPTALSGVSVTASQQVTAVGKMTLQVLSFTGAGSVIGHTGGGSSGAPGLSFDAVAANSLVFGAGFTWKNAETTTASDGQTVLHAVSGDGTFGNTWTQQVDVATTTAGQAVVLSDTAPTDETWDLAGVEVTPAADTVAGTLTVDQNVFSADVSDGSGTATSPAISTSQPGELLVALVSAGGFAATQTLTVSGGGLTWTRLQQANSQRGDAEIWTATATTALSGVTVQAVQDQPVGKISLEVVSLIGAQTAVGYSAGAASGAATVSFNALSGNSLVFAAGFDWQTAATTTAGAGQSITHQISITGTNGNTWMQQLDAPVAAAGDGVTINDTAPTSEAWNLAAVEVVPTQVSAATTNHYDNTGDAPAWITTPGGGWTRNIAGLDGGLDAIVTYDPTLGATSTSLQLLDLHADVAGVADPAGTGLAATYTYDEFGNPTTTNTARYGWLGGKTRTQAGIGNLTLLGVRVYNPATGRFLQTDPIPGGSCNPYDYACQDPVNQFDLNGTFSCGWFKWACHAISFGAGRLARAGTLFVGGVKFVEEEFVYASGDLAGVALSSGKYVLKFSKVATGLGAGLGEVAVDLYKGGHSIGQIALRATVSGFVAVGSAAAVAAFCATGVGCVIVAGVAMIAAHQAVGIVGRKVLGSDF
jgi:RHS repeat-associated protein